MLNESQINLLPERIYQRLNAINAEYLEGIGGVLKKIGELRPKDVHQLQQMYNYGADMERVINKLSQVSDKNIEEIYEIFDIVAKESYEYAKPFYEAKGISFIPYSENEDLQRYVESLAKQTAGEYVNLTQHTAFAVFDKSGKELAPLFESGKHKMATSLSDTYTQLVDYAVTKVQLGTESYTKAVRDICKTMAASGIKTVEYATGYKRRLDAAVRQNVLWGIKECNQNIADRVGEDFGADGYEISYHSNPRPSHADMAGKTFAIGEARIVKGVYYPSFEKEAKPLLEEYGCLHFKFSVLLGISRSAYGKEQLAELKAQDKQPFEFEGKAYTKYEAGQLQGKLENAMIRQKELANMAKAAGDEGLRREVQGNINLLSSKYQKLCQASGLPTRAERMQVSGFRAVKASSSQAGQAKYKAIVNRKSDQEQYEKYIGILGAENMPKTFDLFQKMKYNDSEAWEDIKYYARNINGRPIECVKIDRELSKMGINRGKCYPVDDVKAYILPDDHSTKEPYHIMKRMKERHITDDEVRSYKENASFMLVQWGGKRRRYYTAEGISVISINGSEWVYKTAWKKDDFDDEIITVLEVMKKYER